MSPNGSLLLLSCIAASLMSFTACKRAAPAPRVFAFNGFDFPVSVTFHPNDGRPVQTLTVPPHSKMPVALRGIGTADIKALNGTLLAEKIYSFGTREPVKGCYRIFNLLGSAAIEKENLVYGKSFGYANKTYLNPTDYPCNVSWFFVQPPKAIRVAKYTPGRTLGWVHYLGEGDWTVAVEQMLQKGWRGDAQRLVGSVLVADAGNSKLAAAQAMLATHNIPEVSAAVVARAIELDRKENERGLERLKRDAEKAAQD